MPATRSETASLPETPLVDPAWTDGQKRIFESALSVFAEKGFAATTTVEIAKKAGVAEALLFKYFGNKRSLLKAIALPVLEKWVAPMSVKRLREVFAHPGADPANLLHSLIAERRGFFRSHRPVARIVMQEAMIDPEIRAVVERTFSAHVFPVFRQAIVEFQKRGSIAPYPPETILRLIASSVAGYILLTEFFAPEENWNHEREIHDTIQILLYGFSGEAKPGDSGKKAGPAAKSAGRRTHGGRKATKGRRLPK